MSTPIREQYLDLKRRFPGVVLFFRLGDFYETFDDDARLVAGELQITLTSKPMGKDLRVPLAGVPHHSIHGHVAKLVARGHRVAICEQLADPSEVKGLVPRDVVRVVTAGTITPEHNLAPDAPNYLASWVERGTGGLALADITTGEIRLARGDPALHELQAIPPAELLFEEGSRPPESPGALSPRPVLSGLQAEFEVIRQFGEHAREVIDPGSPEAGALAQLLAYLRETYPAALGSLQRLRPGSDRSVLSVDQRTLRNLDIVPGPGRGPSLLGVVNRTSSAMGVRLLRQWLTRPLRDRDALADRHDTVAWAARDAVAREQTRSAMSSMPDLARLIGRVGSRSAGPRDLDSLRHGLRQAAALEDLLGGIDVPPLLERLRAAIGPSAEALSALENALAEDPPATFDEGGVIRSGFLPEVDSLHEIAHDARAFLLALERDERERTGIKTLKVGHNRVFGYYLEVTAANAALVPDDYQRRQTLIGAERFVTPALKEYESQLMGARDRLAELERQAFAQLVETLAADLPRLQSAADAIAAIDALLALGLVAAERGYVRPQFSTDGSLALIEARHPVVEAALGPGRFVPNDCSLDDDCQILLLTGPNMSGKSTYLRQIALIAIMAQAGSFVPAVTAKLPLFDRVFTRIGAQDDLAAGQSTFMVEMVETAHILHQATPDSLIVLDEVGRGTSTFDGMAIARAVVEFLHNRREIAAKTLFATHYHELTALAGVLPRVRNAHVAVHEENGEVVFAHRIVDGPSDRSYGIHVARLAGLPSGVISRAEHLLDELESGSPRLERPRPAAVQAVLFREPESPAIERLRGMDVDAMTPLEAIQALYELRRAAGAGAE